jgi:hypothetical protein
MRPPLGVSLAQACCSLVAVCSGVEGVGVLQPVVCRYGWPLRAVSGTVLARKEKSAADPERTPREGRKAGAGGEPAGGAGARTIHAQARDANRFTAQGMTVSEAVDAVLIE